MLDAMASDLGLLIGVITTDPLNIWIPLFKSY